jgi:hypothetical protein
MMVMRLRAVRSLAHTHAVIDPARATGAHVFDSAQTEQLSPNSF